MNNYQDRSCKLSNPATGMWMTDRGRASSRQQFYLCLKELKFSRCLAVMLTALYKLIKFSVTNGGYFIGCWKQCQMKPCVAGFPNFKNGLFRKLHK